MTVHLWMFADVEVDAFMDSEMQTLHEMYFDVRDNKILLVLPQSGWPLIQWNVFFSFI